MNFNDVEAKILKISLNEPTTLSQIQNMEKMSMIDIENNIVLILTRFDSYFMDDE